jgi:long-chain acyl-CoA synthetase
MNNIVSDSPLARNPSKVAMIMATSGEEVTYRELDERSNRVAHLLRRAGVERGGVVALCMDTNRNFMEILWALQRAGLGFVPISTHLTTDEIAYIVNDSNAAAIFASASLGDVAAKLKSQCPGLRARYSVGGDLDGFESYAAAIACLPLEPIVDESAGRYLLYSSGTTGRPKGIEWKVDARATGRDHLTMERLSSFFGMGEDTIYLSPAPLYHSAPLTWTLRTLRLGGTIVIMEHFDAEATLANIEKYRATHAQFVPTMFVRLLKLSDEVRGRYDLGSLRAAIHAAAPCPVEVKQQMIDWWGPIVHEFYGASEGPGITALSASEWLDHKGSVGKAIMGIPHVVDEDGSELPAGDVGIIWFESGGQWDYLGDPEKTAESIDARGWRSVGDIGRLDEDGYLYLTDRKSNMIISGGVNIYPQEAENILISHPAVLDVAVIGVPDPDFGEVPKAVVELVAGHVPSDALAHDIIAFCRASLSKIKCPKSVDFTDHLPRHPNGKLYKRKLRDAYWAGRESTLV